MGNPNAGQTAVLWRIGARRPVIGGAGPTCMHA
eukprot:CAMPEP_0171262750 /NCGR_PEP_ID=MMETSP0790-20130122/56732_1 /TAXON_ID=2925 /ORGANISM="Alexandrium catenella, Strain OF101" /LENGTH=32 /DNA_ID= /DNA_START= /DNA_END= /DNA_ORIENTATION=